MSKKTNWSPEIEEHIEKIRLMGDELLKMINDVKKPKTGQLVIDKQTLLDIIDEAQTGYDNAIKEAKSGLLPYQYVEGWLIKLNNFKWVLEISKEI